MIPAQVVSCVIMVAGYASALLLLRCSSSFGLGADKAEHFHRGVESWVLDSLYRLCLVLAVVCIVIGSWGLAKLMFDL